MNKIILTGFPKTGNTHARFVIFNYWNILENNAVETLTYRELIYANEDIWDGKGDQYPQVFFMHMAKNGRTMLGYNRGEKFEMYNREYKIIYVTRNPFDCMISYFHYNKNRDLKDQHISYRNINTLEEHTKHFLPLYINHIQSTMPYADVVLNYDKLRKDPSGFRDAIKLVFGVVNEEIFQKAIEMSTFDNIKKMGIEKKQKYGLASSYRGHFCRDGRSGQYKEVMTPELIEWIREMCLTEGIIV